MSVATAAQAEAVDGNILFAFLVKVDEGDVGTRMPVERTGVAGKIADRLNEMVLSNRALEAELARVSAVVGRQGRLSERMRLQGPGQRWPQNAESANASSTTSCAPSSP